MVLRQCQYRQQAGLLANDVRLTDRYGSGRDCICWCVHISLLVCEKRKVRLGEDWACILFYFVNFCRQIKLIVYIQKQENVVDGNREKGGIVIA